MTNETQTEEHSKALEEEEEHMSFQKDYYGIFKYFLHIIFGNKIISIKRKPRVMNVERYINSIVILFPISTVHVNQSCLGLAVYSLYGYQKYISFRDGLNYKANRVSLQCSFIRSKPNFYKVR